MKRGGLSFLRQEVNIPYKMFVSILSAAAIAGAGAWSRQEMNRPLVIAAILANTIICFVISGKIQKETYNLTIVFICIVICCLVAIFS